MGQTRKTLPKNTSIDTIAIVRDKKTKTRRFKIKIGEFDDAGKIYNKSHGIVARKEDDKPFYENVKDFFNNLPTRATNVHTQTLTHAPARSVAQLTAQNVTARWPASCCSKT